MLHPNRLPVQLPPELDSLVTLIEQSPQAFLSQSNIQVRAAALHATKYAFDQGSRPPQPTLV